MPWVLGNACSIIGHYVLYCSAPWQSGSDLEIIPRKKYVGIAQLIPNLHSQASCLLPYPVQAKGRLDKAHCEFLAPVSVEPCPCMRRACSISTLVYPNIQRMGPQDQGEKLEDPRKKRESCRFIPGLGRDWLLKAGGERRLRSRKEKQLRYQGQKYITEQVVVCSGQCFQALWVRTRAEQSGFFPCYGERLPIPVSFPWACENVWDPEKISSLKLKRKTWKVKINKYSGDYLKV